MTPMRQAMQYGNSKDLEVTATRIWFQIGRACSAEALLRSLVVIVATRDSDLAFFHGHQFYRAGEKKQQQLIQDEGFAGIKEV